MSASLAELIATRRNLAAERATTLAEQIESGDSRSVARQAEIEQALADLKHYRSLEVDLREVAADTAVYNQNNKRSIIADMRAKSPEAEARITASQRAIAADRGIEVRDLGGGLALATIPDWLVGASRPTAIKKAPLLTIAAKPLAKSGLELRLPQFSTEPVAGPQTALNAALPTATFVDAGLEAPVRTFGCQVDVSVQLLEQSPIAVDRQILPAMVAATDAAIEESLWTGTGSGGTVEGLIAADTVNTETYTDASATLVEAFPKIESLIRETEAAGAWGGTPIVLVHPRRLSWIRQQAVVEGRDLGWSPPPFAGATAGWFGGNVAVIADSAVPTSLGSGTNEDVVAVMRSLDVLDLYVSAPRVRVSEGVAASNSLSATITVSRMVAFSAERLAGAIGILSGTGLAAP